MDNATVWTLTRAGLEKKPFDLVAFANQMLAGYDRTERPAEHAAVREDRPEEEDSNGKGL